jgi:hypothetical protein
MSRDEKLHKKFRKNMETSFDNPEVDTGYLTEREKSWLNGIHPNQAKFQEPLNDGNAEAERPKEVYVQKYKGYEAILIGGVPYFLELVNTQIILHKEIVLHDMVLKPYERTMYLNKEYSFKSVKEIDDYVIRALKEYTDYTGSLFTKIKGIWSKYIDANEDHLTICAADTIFSYFQDKLGMTHYLLFVGDNGTGKSNNLKVLQHLGYRALFDTSITTANIYQFLGSIEEGQGIILEDESDSIDQDLEKMKIYKVGYQSGTKVTRLDLSGKRKQDSYWTYCFKAFSAERQPNNTKAKGFMERVFVLPCSTGKPKHDITEVINPAGDKKQEQLLEELNDIRKLLLMFRLLCYNQPIPDIELNIINRDKQLCKPLLRLFQDSECVNEIATTLSKLLAEKRDRKSDTLDARLYEIITNLIGQQGKLDLDNKMIWQSVMNNIDGKYDVSKPMVYETEEFYKISQIKVSSILIDKFGAKKIRIGHEGNRGLKFNQETISRLESNYAKSEPIKIIKNADTADNYYPISRQASAKTDTYDNANYNNNQENIDRIEHKIAEPSPKPSTSSLSDSFQKDGKVVSGAQKLSALSASEELVTCPKCGHKDTAFYMKVHNCRLK